MISHDLRWFKHLEWWFSWQWEQIIFPRLFYPSVVVSSWDPSPSDGCATPVNPSMFWGRCWWCLLAISSNFWSTWRWSILKFATVPKRGYWKNPQLTHKIYGKSWKWCAEYLFLWVHWGNFFGFANIHVENQMKSANWSRCIGVYHPFEPLLHDSQIMNFRNTLRMGNCDFPNSVYIPICNDSYQSKWTVRKITEDPMGNCPASFDYLKG